MLLTKQEKAFKYACYILALIMLLLCLYPLLYTFFVSLCSKDEWTARNGLLIFLPSEPTLQAYGQILGSSGMIMQSIGISVARCVVGTLLCVFFNVCVGYALSRKELPGRKAIMLGLMVTMVFGAGLIPGYLTIKELGLLNSFWALVIPSIMSSWNILIFKQFFEGIPPALEEAAIVDGAGEFRLMTQIVLPMSKAVVSAIALFSFVGHWNAWFDAMIYIDSNHAELWPLQLFTMLNFNNMSQMNVNPSVMQEATMIGSLNPMSMKMALTIVTMLPLLVIYPFFQKYFTAGVYTGAVKG